jgi:hypothetical protein
MRTRNLVTALIGVVVLGSGALIITAERCPVRRSECGLATGYASP